MEQADASLTVTHDGKSPPDALALMVYLRLNSIRSEVGHNWG